MAPETSSLVPGKYVSHFIMLSSSRERKVGPGTGIKNRPTTTLNQFIDTVTQHTCLPDTPTPNVDLSPFSL